MRARSELQAVLDESGSPARARLTAWWGLGRLRHDSGEITEALDAYRCAERVCDELGDGAVLAEVRVSWALCLQAAGDSAGAIAQLDAAEPLLQGAALARLISQRAIVLMYLGQAEAAVGEYNRALPLLRAAGDQLPEVRLLGNRGVALMQLGDVRGACADFLAARELGTALGQQLLVAGAMHNLAYLAGRLGDVPEALRSFDEAREQYRALGTAGRLLAALDTDECEVQLLAGLGEEAREVAGRLLAESEASGNVLQLGESHLTMARAELLLGEHRSAAEHADRAAALFRRSDRGPWGALATYVGVMARADGAAAGESASATEDFDTLRTVAATLERQGWSTEAAEVRVVVGRMAIAAGRLDEATEDLERAAASRYDGRPTQRIEAWHATALLRSATGDTRGAKQAVSQGLRLVDQHRATLGATELRARASAHGAALAELGLRLALTGRHAKDVLIAAERWRAGALAMPPATPSDDDDVAADLAELRRLDGELRQAVLAGAEQASTALAAQRGAVDALERSITRRTRMRAGDPRAVSMRLELATLRRALGGRTLVEYVEVDARLLAVVVTPRRSRLVELGTTEHVTTLTDHLAFAVRRLAMLPDGHPGVHAAGASLMDAAAALDTVVGRPLRLRPGEAIALVPPAHLQLLPWTVLGTFRAAGEVALAPSAAWWLRGASTLAGSSTDISGGVHVLAVDGGELPSAGAELEAIAALHPTAVVLRGADATAARVLDEMQRADVVHLAAHGRFRADNPMFSSIRLVDGPLMVHDLERLERAPGLVVLASCHAGRGAVLAGDELLGTAAALTSLGVGSVVAPTTAVRDDLAAEVAIGLHQAMHRGITAAAALCDMVDRAVTAGRLSEAAVAAAFQCVGSGHDAGTGVPPG